jgi:hypothetical protein
MSIKSNVRQRQRKQERDRPMKTTVAFEIISAAEGRDSIDNGVPGQCCNKQGQRKDE